MGDTITNLSGVLSYQWAGNSASGATWRVRASQDGENSFTNANDRKPASDDVSGTLSVASFNVLNYFTTLDDGSTTANGSNPRGADDATEFARQTEKLVTALAGMDADILGLVELENDFLAGSAGNAIEFLVAELNATMGAGTYDWVDPGQQFVGDDTIAVGMIYKPDQVRLASGTTVEILTDADLAGLGLDPSLGSTVPVFDGPSTNRAPLLATFEQVLNGAAVNVVVNHFKSKGSVGPAPGDVDAGDGAGNNNETRLNASIALDAWLGTDPTGSGDGDFLILGDLNAYAMEDPITYLEAEGYTDLAEAWVGPSGYSYVFDGQTGTLDYAMANAPLASQVTGATIWNVNADEPDALDYNLDFGRDSAVFDGTVPYRNSDHDPVLVGLALTVDGPIVGTPNADVLNGDHLANLIDALAGDDLVNGLGGADTITLGAGFDRLSGTLDDLLGDTITDFSVDDAIVIQGAQIGRDQIDVVYGSAVLNVDGDGDGAADGSITLDGDFTGGDFMAVREAADTLVTFETFLPELRERRAVDPNLVNGINNQEFLTGDGNTDFLVTMRDMGWALFNNALGVYEIDAGGNILDTRILFDSTKRAGGQTAEITGVEDGHQLGFFIVQKGARWARSLDEADVVSFVNGSGAAANLSDGADLSIAVNGIAVDEFIFHSFDAGMNADGVEHALSGVEEGGEAITIGFEDLTGGGDRDYEDVVFLVEHVDEFLFA